MTSPILFFTFCFATLASAAAVAEPGERGERRGPPPEALEACESLAEGDSCSFTGREGEALNGRCFLPPRDDAELACRPDNAPPRGRESLER